MSEIIEAFSQLQKQEIIEEIDLELCRFLRDQDPEVSDEVLKAACLVSYLYRQGDVCLLLDEYVGKPLFDVEDQESDDNNIWVPDIKTWQSALSKSRFVGTPGSFKPLILDNQNRIYLHKLWYHEKGLADALLEKSKAKKAEIDQQLLKEGLKRLFTFDEKNETDWQQVATALAVRQKLSIISGGPGTGKTSTVVRILALIIEQAEARDEMSSIALTAPTGKAAAHLQNAIQSAKDSLPIEESVKRAIPDEAVTLHQLLGARRHTSRFKHNRENPLPQDVIIVDEVSMVDQTLMSRLMQVLLTDTQLILLGDKDQLASVEAGSVLGDICLEAKNFFSEEAARWLQTTGIHLPEDRIETSPEMLTDHVTLLTKSYRFDEQSGVGRLSKSVNKGDVYESIQLIVSDRHKDITLINNKGLPAFKKLLEQKTEQYFQQLQYCTLPTQAFSLLHDFRILAAHRKGPWGIQHINQLIEKILYEKGQVSKYSYWYPGKPIIINVNDYALDLFNGDTGICLPDEKGELRVFFQHDGSVRGFAPGRLPDHNRAYALTVHKSQGSEFNHVLLILPAKASNIVSRELIYTAITRARTDVSIWCSKDVLQKSIEKKLQRSSGLADRLWNNSS